MGGGAWPPPSPYVWRQPWWDQAGNAFFISLTFRYSDTAPRAVLGMDYDLDPGCPWNTLQMRKADGAILEQQIPRTARTGTVTAVQLAAVHRVSGSPGTNGLVNMDDFFLGGSITVYST
jgi:hypothetical protein